MTLNTDTLRLLTEIVGDVTVGFGKELNELVNAHNLNPENPTDEKVIAIISNYLAHLAIERKYLIEALEGVSDA